MSKQALLILSFFLTGYFLTKGQTVSHSVISSGGGYYTNATRSNSWTVAEGKEYVVKDGDVMNFLFNV